MPPTAAKRAMVAQAQRELANKKPRARTRVAPTTVTIDGAGKKDRAVSTDPLYKSPAQVEMNKAHGPTPRKFTWSRGQKVRPVGPLPKRPKR